MQAYTLNILDTPVIFERKDGGFWMATAKGVVTSWGRPLSFTGIRRDSVHRAMRDALVRIQNTRGNA